MAKTNGPLFSLEASGSLGGALVYSKNKGRNITRTLVKPANPRSAGQVAVRGNHAGLVAIYQANVAMIKAAFAERAAVLQTGAFQAFIGFSQKRLGRGLGPANSLTPTDAPPASNSSIDAAAVQDRYVQVSLTHSVAADCWGTYLYRHLGADPTGVRNEIVELLPLSSTEFVDGPLVAGTWHYAVASVSENGGIHAVSAATNAMIV